MAAVAAASVAGGAVADRVDGGVGSNRHTRGGRERGVDTAVGSPVPPPPPAASSSRFSHYRREPPRHRQAPAVVVTRPMRSQHVTTVVSHFVAINRARVYDDRKM